MVYFNVNSSVWAWFFCACLLAMPRHGHAQKDSIDVNIYFASSSYSLDAAAIKQLDSLADIVKQPRYKDFEIYLAGYCDAAGSQAYNRRLSYNRIMTVKKYLLRQHVAGIFPPGRPYGKRIQVNANRTSAEKQMNRRVHIHIVPNGKYYYMHQVADSLAMKVPDEPDMPHVSISPYFDTAHTGTHIILPEFNFYPGVHHLLPEAKPLLDSLLHIMQKYPSMHIMLEGHVCCTPDGKDGEDNETQTWNLSENRAKYVYDWLTDKGIDKTRLSYRGMARRRPLIAPERTPEDQDANRRVEVVVTGR